MSCFRHAARPLLFAGTALAMLSPAYAQDNNGTDTVAATGVQTTRTDNGDIVVIARNYVPQGARTATKTDIPLIETPQSISVVTRDQIDLLNFTDTQQAVRYTASVFGESYGPDPRYDFVTVRGFTPRQYIDGLAVPATTTIAATGVDLYAFESLDILKGPSSALYGLAPPGGILNETSRRPSSEFGGEIEAKYGSHNFAEGAMTLTGPATPWLDVRFTGLYRDADGEVDHTHTQRLLASPSATLKLGDSTKLTGLLYYQYDKVEGGAGGFLPIWGTLLDNPNGRISRKTNLDDPKDLFERHQYGVGYDLEHRFSDTLTFHSNTKWSDYHEATPIGLYSGGGFVNTTDPTLPSYYRDLQQYNFSYKESVRSFATDNRLDATIDTGAIRNKLLLGVDYRNIKNVAAYNFVFAGVIDAFDPVYDPTYEKDVGYPLAYNNQSVKQTGVYGQDQIKIGQLFVMLGGRYDWVDENARLSGIKQKQHKFTYRVGANYVTASGLAPYISYSTSFEPVIGTDSVTKQPFKPSSVRQWEGGVKYDARGLPKDVKLFATLAGFDIKESNFVSPQIGVTPVFVTQGGEVEVYGAEAEIVARIHEQLTINASYSYNHSKVLSAPGEPADVGYPLPTTPKHKASLFVDYTLQSGALAGIGGGVGVRYTSKSTGALPGAFATPVIYADAATLFDATLHYDVPGWRFAINGSNVADKRYVARCASNYGCVYGAGRQIIGTITKKF